MSFIACCTLDTLQRTDKLAQGWSAATYHAKNLWLATFRLPHPLPLLQGTGSINSLQKTCILALVSLSGSLIRLRHTRTFYGGNKILDTLTKSIFHLLHPQGRLISWVTISALSPNHNIYLCLICNRHETTSTVSSVCIAHWLYFITWWCSLCSNWRNMVKLTQINLRITVDAALAIITKSKRSHLLDCI